MLEPIISYLLSVITPKLFAAYCTIACLQVWITIYRQKKLAGTPELNAKYAPFVRTDYKDWHYIKGAITSIFFLFPIRYVFCWLIVFV
jgi:hypothetical protein